MSYEKVIGARNAKLIQYGRSNVITIPKSAADSMVIGTRYMMVISQDVDTENVNISLEKLSTPEEVHAAAS